MTTGTSTIRIPLESGYLLGTLQIPASARGLIVLANAGANDSYVTRPDLPDSALARRGYGTLAVNLLTADEETRDRPSGRYRLDLPLLASRVCQVLSAIRSNPDCQSYPMGLFVEGMAGAAAMVSASHHKEIRAIVSWNGRADLADDALRAVTAPTLLLADHRETHVVDLNRKAAALLGGIHKLDVVDAADPPANPHRPLADRVADWFDAFVPIGGAARKERAADRASNR